MTYLWILVALFRRYTQSNYCQFTTLFWKLFGFIQLDRSLLRLAVELHYHQVIGIGTLAVFGMYHLFDRAVTLGTKGFTAKLVGTDNGPAVKRAFACETVVRGEIDSTMKERFVTHSALRTSKCLSRSAKVEAL